MFKPLRTLAKFACLLALVSAATTQIAYASLADPDFQNYTLDSGAYKKLALRGDEYFSWYESMNGNVYLSQDGEIYYATFDAYSYLVPSIYTINDFPDENFRILNIQDPAVIAAVEAQSSMGEMHMHEATAGILEDPAGTEGIFPPAPTTNLLTVLIGFNDVQLIGSLAHYDDIIYNVTNQYYVDVSRGQFNYTRASETQGNAGDGIIQVNLNQNHPDPQGSADRNVLADALDAADPYINFADYDTNDDGQVVTEELNIMFVFAGWETASAGTSRGPSVWAHVTSLGYQARDGINLNMRYARFGELHGSGALATFGIIAHELGHLTFSWPDLYDRTSTQNDGSNSIGRWCLMASGSWNRDYSVTGNSGAQPAIPNPFLRDDYGWEDGRMISGNHTLYPTLSGGGALKVETDNELYYAFVEAKQLTSWDAGLNLNNPGMMIWKKRNNGSNSTRNASNGDLYYPFITVVANEAGFDGNSGASLGAGSVTWPSISGNNSIGTQGDPNLHVSDGQNRSITYLQSWDLTNISTDASGVVTFSASKTSNYPPIAAINAPAGGFISTPVTFDASGSRDQDGLISSYSWQGPWGTQITTGPTFEYSFASTGIYTVTVVTTDNEGATNSASVDIEIVDPNAPPVAVLNGYTNTTINLADSITFLAFDSYDPKPDGGISAYHWTGPWGTQQSAPYFTHRFLEPGVFTITLQITDRVGNTATDSVEITVVDDGVNLPPVAVLPDQEITVMQANAYQFRSTSSYDEDGEIVDIQWTGPFGTRASSIFYYVFYEDVGQYEVTLTVTDNEGASSSATMLVNVVPREFNRTYNDVYIRGTNNNWQASRMELVYDYWWQLDVYFAGGANERFKFDIYGDWSLNFGDNEYDGVADETGNDIPVTEGAGNYRIRFNDQTKAWSMEKIVEPIPPVADAGPDVTVEVGSTVQFDGSGSSDPDGSIVFYEWDNGLTGVNPSLVYDTIGTFTVTLTVRDNDNLTATDTLTVTVTDIDTSYDSVYPQANLRGTANAWAASAMTLVADYTWQITATFGDTSTERFKFDIYGDWGTNFGDTNGDGNLEQGGGDIAITEGAGDYIVTFNDQNLMYTIEKVVGPTAPVADAGSDVSIRPGETVNFNGSATAEAAIVSYVWTSAAWTGELTGTQPSFTFNTPGSFVVTLTVTDENGLADDDTMVVTVTENIAPTASIQGGDITVTLGSSVTFDGSGSSDADGSIASYLWDNGDSATTSTRTFNSLGQFAVSLTVTDNEGASASTSVNVTVEEEPAGVEVTFTCNNGNTSPGTSVYVVGNLPELGNWSVASAAQVLGTENYPSWSATFTNMPANTTIDWKCVKANETTLVITEWQGGGNNQVSTSASGSFTTSGSF